MATHILGVLHGCSVVLGRWAMSRWDDDFIQMAKAAREAKGWDQSRLSDELSESGVDLSQSALSRLEGGHRRLGFGEAVAISMVLGLDLDEFLGNPSHWHVNVRDIWAVAKVEEAQKILHELLGAIR
ncbi:helix-turn-helix DNA binding domain protein [Mycobacterium phage phiGD20-1]|nr:helix-turn-helix DNA binding domain protein [Mycobacterium phage phiGD23-1]QPO17817.1 helix-turn-helix DNA binding domain protein [Mycobacterium phage phiGD20-1]